MVRSGLLTSSICPNRKLLLSFTKALKFIRDVQVDEKTGKVFALFESNGIIELQEVNLNTGLINASYKIPFIFVNHVKVHDDYIYFIRKESGYDDGEIFVEAENTLSIQCLFKSQTFDWVELRSTFGR